LEYVFLVRLVAVLADKPGAKDCISNRLSGRFLISSGKKSKFFTKSLAIVFKSLEII